MKTIKASIAAVIFALNTIFICVLMCLFLPFKLLIPHERFQAWLSSILAHIGEMWIDVNNFELGLFHRMNWQVHGLEGLKKNKSYLIFANHQSWVDIVMLQKIFNHRIPFLRFFLKKELIYTPFLGIAWWILDFPFMRRYSKEYLEKHPEKRGQDLETTRKACEKYKGIRVSIINFLEGTRFRPSKHEQQQSPYKNLLNPKTGGLAFVIEAMGEQFESILDVTIFYPNGVKNLWGLFLGDVTSVHMSVRQIPIPKEFLGRKYLEDESYRENLQAWVRGLWSQKDNEITALKSLMQPG